MLKQFTVFAFRIKQQIPERKEFCGLPGLMILTLFQYAPYRYTVHIEKKVLIPR